MRWLSKDCPDLIVVKILMVDVEQNRMGLSNIDEHLVDFYLDLSKLARVKRWYEKGSYEPSKTECLCDFMGIEQVILILRQNRCLRRGVFTNLGN